MSGFGTNNLSKGVKAKNTSLGVTRLRGANANLLSIFGADLGCVFDANNVSFSAVGVPAVNGDPVLSFSCNISNSTATQSTLANRATLVTNAYYGNNVFRFNGVNTFYDVTGGSILDVARNVPGFTFITLSAPRIVSPAGGIDIAWSSNAGTTTTRLQLSSSATANRIQPSGRRLDSDASSTVILTGNVDRNTTTEFYANVVDVDVFNGSIGTSTNYQDLTAAGAATAAWQPGSAGQNMQDSSSARCYIGAAVSGTAFANRDIGLIAVVKRRPTAAEINQLKLYFTRRLTGKVIV